MGNSPTSHPSQSRSYSDDMLNAQQRHHAKSDEIPYSPQPTITNNGSNRPYFSAKHHYNGHHQHHHNGHNGHVPFKKNKLSNRISNKSKSNRLKLDNKNNSDPKYGTKTSISRSSRSATNTSTAFGRSISESTTGTKILIMQGWLTKLGESSKKLKKRYWKLYDNGKLSYNTKQNGSFKKYADLKGGIDSMSLKDSNGFEIKLADRHLIFYAETTRERDEWFAIIFQHYFQKGKEKVALLAKSSMNDSANKKEADDKFDVDDKPKLNGNATNKKKKKQNKKRRNSFDSTKAAAFNERKKNRRNRSNTTIKNIRSQSSVNFKNKHKNGHKNGDKTGNKTGNKEDGMIIFSEQYMNQQCDGKTCLSLERVHYVLKKYDLWRAKEHKIMSLGMYKYINNGLGEYYGNTDLLNDFNHLISFHDNVFNHIYEYFDGECDIEKCLLIKRLHRDRNYYKNDEKRKQIYYDYDDEKEINTQQILDKIHCYYRHSYDLGFRVKKSKLLTIQKNAKQHRRRQTSKNSRISSFNMNTSNVFTYNGPNKKESTEESKEATHIIFNNDTLTDGESEDQSRNNSKNNSKNNSNPHSNHSNHSNHKNNNNNNKKSDDNDDDINDLDDVDDDPHGFEDEWKLLEICGLIQQKRANLRDLRGTNRINMNKFISIADKSQRYHYWRKYDDDDDSNWLIQIKYDNFKTEMLSNNLYTLSLKQWQYLCEKANDHFNMKRSKKIRPHKYWAELYDLPRKGNNSSFSISQSHFIAIMLYCNFDILQKRFAQTFYRLNDNETTDSLKNRHSNFFHFGRLLRELIECFGKKIYNKNIVFYHGITDDMMFIETRMYFHAPLSTTTSIEVAIAYSNNNDNDYLLELMDDDTVLGMARYFDCCWLSDFGNESEKFFIGGYKPLKIHTVLDAVLGRNYINYLKALHIIDEMMQGYYFDTESDEIKQIILHLLQCQISNHKKKMSKPLALNNELLKEIRDLNKKPSLYMGVLSDDNDKQYDENKDNITLQIDTPPLSALNDIDDDDEKSINDLRRKISRKISKSFDISRLSTTIDMEEYDYFNETPKYITKLVDYYCQNVINVCCDWTNMNQHDWKGFKFCKKLLCIDNNKYEWIKLKVFLTLFPNLKEINVRNIKLSNHTINDIYKFLKKAKTDNKYHDLYRIEIFEVDQETYSISQCLEEYLDKFKDVGWTITFNPFEDEMCILKL